MANNGLFGEKKKSGLENNTEGWLTVYPTSAPPKTYDFIDVFGVVDGCVYDELFYVQVVDEKITKLEPITRTLPDDFDVEEWESLLAGVPTTQDYVNNIFNKINGWAIEKKRAIAAFAKIKNISAGTSEMDYLNAAQGFYIHLNLMRIPVIPGVYNIKGPGRVKEGVRTEYIYAFNDNNKKIVPLGIVTVLNGKVSGVNTN